MPIRRAWSQGRSPKTLACSLLAVLAANLACGSEPPPMRAAKVLARSRAVVHLRAEDARVTVPLAPLEQSLSAHLEDLPSEQRIYLVVRGLVAAQQPGVSYSLFLDLPADHRPTSEDPHHVGIVHFFAARPPGAANAADAESPVNVDTEKVFFSFDITATAQALRDRGGLAAATTLTWVPDGTPVADADASVALLELIRQ
jgi:hypothetical protein